MTVYELLGKCDVNRRNIKHLLADLKLNLSNLKSLVSEFYSDPLPTNMYVMSPTDISICIDNFYTLGYMKDNIDELRNTLSEYCLEKFREDLVGIGYDKDTLTKEFLVITYFYNSNNQIVLKVISNSAVTSPSDLIDAEYNKLASIIAPYRPCLCLACDKTE